MQVRGTFPELSAGQSKSKPSRLGRLAKAITAKSPVVKAEPRVPGVGGFSVKRAPRQNHAPKTFAGRRDAAHSRYVK